MDRPGAARRGNARIHQDVALSALDPGATTTALTNAPREVRRSSRSSRTHRQGDVLQVADLAACR